MSSAVGVREWLEHLSKEGGLVMEERGRTKDRRATQSPTVSQVGELLDAIERLAEFHGKGLITGGDYRNLKKRLLTDDASANGAQEGTS